jgi:hypothetical protein
MNRYLGFFIAALTLMFLVFTRTASAQVPTILSVSSNTANGSYTIGTLIDVTVQFNQVVFVI